MTRSKLAVLAVVLMLATTPVAFAGGGHSGSDQGESAHGIVKPGGNPVKHRPVHGPGSSHNPIILIRHPPLHGAGSSHDPIVEPRNCNDPNTVCRRP